MSKNQLFNNLPPYELVEKILDYFVKPSFNTNFFFSRKDIESKDILKNIKNELDELSKYYIPCKKKVYFKNINSKNIITILRQILKVYNYKINAVEKYSNGKKYLLYNLEKIEDIDNNKLDLTLNFD